MLRKKSYLIFNHLSIVFFPLSLFYTFLHTVHLFFIRTIKFPFQMYVMFLAYINRFKNSTSQAILTFRNKRFNGSKLYTTQIVVAAMSCIYFNSKSVKYNTLARPKIRSISDWTTIATVQTTRLRTLSQRQNISVPTMFSTETTSLQSLSK